jgi:hypothetical protein
MLQAGLLVTLGGCHFLDCLVVCGSFEARKEIVRCSGQGFVRGVVLTPRGSLSYGPPWAHYLGGYEDRLLGGPLGLPDLRCTATDGVKHKDYRGEVLS